jgi:hypothetical protein
MELCYDWNCIRNLPGPDDVTIEIHFCGICHSDVNFANNSSTKTPFVPGFELFWAFCSLEIYLFFHILSRDPDTLESENVGAGRIRFPDLDPDGLKIWRSTDYKS